MYHEILPDLRDAYDRQAHARDAATLDQWKLDERAYFLNLLREAGHRTLLEIGAGTGRDGQFFKASGLDVTCVDLSPEMVSLCRSKGLRAHVRDVLDLRLPPGSFDTVYALNSLLHVPKIDLPIALNEIRKLLRPDGLFYLGVYGGVDSEGVWGDDPYEPKRFFSFHTDEGVLEAVGAIFSILSFKRIMIGHSSGLHFQSLVLRVQRSMPA